jgi:two-component system, sensor histidine kinase RegB
MSLLEAAFAPIARAPTFDPSGSGGLRLRTLVGLRWLAILGQTATVLIVYRVLGFDLPLGLCLATIAVSAWVNLALTLAFPAQRLVKEWEGAAQLLFDLCQLAFLLGLTGGIDNPFSLMLIVPATIAAATLRLRWSLVIIYFGLCAVALLTIASQPLPWKPAGSMVLPDLYRFGAALAVSLGLMFTAIYSWRVSVEEARLADALIATQAILAREQQLAAVGSLAAAAAHELGTPLATIQLTSKELMRALPEGLDQEDAALIFSQAQRCRDILRGLTAQGRNADPTVTQASLGQLLREVGESHVTAPANKALVFEMQGPVGADQASESAEDLIVARYPEVLYGLGNLYENALQYARTQATVACTWDKKQISVTIFDDGPGFDPDILARLGEPYVTSRGEAAARPPGSREGMGLGFFIAKTMLERSGAKLRFGNRPYPATGAQVRVEWPRDRLELMV